MKRFLLPLLLVGCGNSGSSNPPAQPEPDAAEAAVVDLGPPPPGPGDPPACAGEKTPGTPPGPRAGHAGVLDKSGAKLVVFGGDTEVVECGATATHKFVDETFVLDVGCGTWRPVSAATKPAARAGHAMVQDPRRDRSLVFGGRARTASSGDYTLFNDLWGFDWGTESWAELATSGAKPSPRAGAAAVYDLKRDRVIVFGGDASVSDTTPTPLDDVFALSLEFREWSQITTTGESPPARFFHAAAIDSSGDKLYVFGGSNPEPTLGPWFNDLWSLDLATNAWTKLESTGDAPQNRIHAGLSVDPTRRVLVVFGGTDDKLGTQNDVHLYDLASGKWTRLNTGDNPKSPSTGACAFPADYTEIDKIAPERRSAFVHAPSRDGIGFIAHAGRSDCGLLGDTYWFNALNETWFPISESDAGHSCLRHKSSCASLCK